MPSNTLRAPLEQEDAIFDLKFAVEPVEPLGIIEPDGPLGFIEDKIPLLAKIVKNISSTDRVSVGGCMSRTSHLTRNEISSRRKWR